MNFWDFIPQLANQFGIAPSQLIFYIGFVTFASNMAARLIPQDATGKLGAVRKVCAIVGAYVPSRVTGNISVTDVAKAIVTNRVEDVKQEVIEAASDPAALIPQVAEAAADVLDLSQFHEFKPAFPGLVKDKSDAEG